MMLMPDPLCSPIALHGGGAGALVVRLGAVQRAVDRRRDRRSAVPSRSISAPSGSALPPLSATSTLPSATTDVAQSSTSGGPSGMGTPMAIGIGGHAPLGAAEGRHQHPEAAGVDDVNGDQALGPPPAPPSRRCARDGPSCAGPPRRRRRSRAFSTASVDRLFADGLAEAVVAVQHRDGAGVHHRLHAPARVHGAAVSSQWT